MAKRPSQESSGKATWFGWKLFEPRDVEGKHACKICHQKIKYNNTTANFINKSDYGMSYLHERVCVLRIPSKMSRFLASNTSLLNL